MIVLDDVVKVEFKDNEKWLFCVRRVVMTCHSVVLVLDDLARLGSSTRKSLCASIVT